MFDVSPLTSRRWFQKTVFVVSAFTFVTILVYTDVVFRARHAYLEGEKFMAWYQNPKLKEEALQQEFLNKKQKLVEKKNDKKISDEEFTSQLESLEFDHQFQLQESPLKYAYTWYKDVYELFSPPESKWVVMARQKAPQVLELWKQELREKKIPFEETMVQ